MAHRFVGLLFSVLFLFFTDVEAQNRFYHVYFDNDNSPASGCSVNFPDFAATIDGIDRRLTITTDSAVPPNISATQLHLCDGLVFDAGTAVSPAALGLNTGINNSDVFEAVVTQTQLGVNRSGNVVFYFATQSDVASDIVLTRGNGGPIILGFTFPVPALGLLALSLLLGILLFSSKKHLSRQVTVSVVFICMATSAWAVSIIIDGQTGDWSSVNPANSDPIGDTSNTGSYADLTAVFVTDFNEDIFVRMDVVDVENQAPTITTPATVSVQENQTAVIDINATDPEGDVEGAGLTYAITGATDDALFNIDANTGVLSFISAPDFENPNDTDIDNIYNVQVTVTDSATATDVQDLEVTVTNDVVDDTAVAFLSSVSSTSDESTAFNVVVELTASAPLTAAVSVDVVDAGGGSASSGIDYTAFGTQTVTFPMGATDGTTMNVVLTPLNDINVENNETVNLQMQNINGPALLGNQVTHTIVINEDDVASVEFDLTGSATPNENTPLDVAVRLNIPSGGQLDVAVSVETIDAGTGTATSGVDYVAFGTQTVTFAVGATNGDLQNTVLTPLDDPNAKGNETVNLVLQNLLSPTVVTFGTQTTHTVSITDDEASVSFQTNSSATTDESTALNVVVVLNTPIPLTAPISVDVVDAGTGTATSGVDYQAFGTQTVTFPMGSTNGTTMNAVLTPIDDINVEANEVIDLNLQNLIGTGSIGFQSTHIAIISEDETARVSFQTGNSATTNESTPLAVNVLLSIPSGGQLDVAISTEVIDAGTGTATGGVDYNAFGTQIINFPIGSTDGTTQASNLTPIDDATSEGNETVNLALQNLAGPPIIVDFTPPTTHTVTITDDEASVAFQAISSSTIDEGTALNVVVVLSTPIPLTAPLSVDVVDVASGSAISGSDYNAIGTQTLTFPMGATNGTTQNVVLTPINDPDVENNETVDLTLQNLVGAGSIGTQSNHTVTITEDDSATVSFQAANSASINEATPLGVNVMLSIPSGGQLNVAITVDTVDVGGGSATSGVDYNVFGTQVASFPIGSTNGSTQTATLTPIDDPTTEGNETVNLALQNFTGPSSASVVAPSTHVATITDDEASVAFQTISSATADEGSFLSLPVVLSTPIPLTAALSVDVVDAGGGTATSVADYIAFGTQTLTFPIGSTNGTTLNATLGPEDDNDVENNETVNLQLQNLVGTGSIGAQNSHTATITENDIATVEFQLANSATVDESTALGIAVLLNIPSGGQLNVPITIDAVDAGGGTATSGVDYSAFGSQGVNFPIGSGNGDTQNTTLTPLDDFDTEGAETVNLQLQNLFGPVLASLGAQTTHTATITDDDNTAPVGNDDSYETIGNTGLHATAGAASTPIRHPFNVLANDTDGELNPLSVVEAMGDVTAPFTGVSTQGGDVVMQANGDFTYYPPAGMTSLVDTFSYTVSDGSLTDVATVSITVTADLVYYVDNTAAPGGTGRDDSRFDQLSDVPTADNTTIYVLAGVGDTSGDLTLGVNQILLGNGVNLEFNVNNTLPNPDVLFTAGTRPNLTGSTTLGSNNSIRGLNIGNTGLSPGILGNTFGTLTVNNVAITGLGKAIDLTNGTTAATFDSIQSNFSPSEGIDLDSVSGNFTVTGLTNISDAVGIGVHIQNSNLTYTFGDVLVNNRGSSGVFINAFTGGVQTGSFGVVTINNQNNSSTTALGIDNIVTGGSTINVTSAVINNNGANGSAIALSNNDGATINIIGGNVFGSSGATVSISNSTGLATYNGSIGNTAGRSVQVLSNSGGGITTLGGEIIDSGTGIFINNNTGATVNFAGRLALTTTTNTAFTATGGGTVNATGLNSFITTTSGIAVNVQNTNIGANDLNFERINAGTGANTAGVGINLESTGTVGGLVVTGSGSSPASGGVIQNKTGADGTTTGGIGIHLNNTSNVSLSNMQLSGFDNFAIRGFDVTNFNLIDSTISGASGDSVANDEGAIRFTNLLGASLFSGNNVAGGIENQLYIANNSGTANITVNDSANDAAQIGLDAVPASTNGNDGILVESQSAAVINLTIEGVNFLGARGDMIQTNVLNNSDFTALLQNNTFNNTHPNIVPGGGGITVSGGNAGGNITQGYDVLSSNFTEASGNNVTVNYVNGSGNVSGAVSNNNIGTAGVAGSGSTDGNGISVGASNNVQHNTTLNSNTIRRVGGLAGIETIANTNVNFNATITNNTVNELENFIFAAMYNLLGGNGTETGTACLDVRNNTFDASSAPTSGNAVYHDQISTSANYNLPGYAGSPNGESGAFCGAGTASANTNIHHVGNGNVMTNGPFSIYAGGVDAGFVCGKTGLGVSCPQ